MSEAKVFSAEQLRNLGEELFVACGAPADEAAIVASRVRRRVVVAEDGNVLRQALTRMLEKMGCQVMPACSQSARTCCSPMWRCRG